MHNEQIEHMQCDAVSLENLKKIELDMLKLFIEICRKYNLRYFLIGGTCLGAVRHKGFIPWDDDIDVGMPRPDYEKFLKIAPMELPTTIFLQTRDTDAQYTLNYAKLRNSNTTFIERSVQNLYINHGIYIDIFPLDGVHSSKICRWSMMLLCRMYKNRIGQIYDVRVEKSKSKQLLNNICNTITKILYCNVDKTISKQNDLIKRCEYDSSDYVSNYLGAWESKEMMKKEYFGEGINGEFENISVVLPSKYHEYLTQLYGDYMVPPPKDQQNGHHYYTILDTEKSYKYYMLNK